MTAMSMAGKAGRSGRSGSESDRRLLGEVKKARDNTPPKKFVDAGKRTVREARKGKK